MTKCPACESENREGARFCDSCGARIEPEVNEPGLQLASTPLEDEDSGASMSNDEGAVNPLLGGEAAVPEVTDEPEPPIDLTEPQDENSADAASAEDEEAPAEATEPEEGLPMEPPKAGYLVFPDNTEQPIPVSQWLIGRTDLAKYLPDPKQANEISRGHLTVFQEGDRFFIEDGTTMVQRKPSTNKTWLVRGTSRIMITGTGRTELQDEDEIDVAELVKLQFVMK